MTTKQQHTPGPRYNARHLLTVAHHDLNTARAERDALRAERDTLDVAYQVATENRDALRAENAKLRIVMSLAIAGEPCRFDPLNPCWDNRPSDVAGKHWGVGDACPVCTARAALKASE